MVKKKNILESLNLFNNSKSAKKSYNGILIIAGILGALFLMGFVMGVGVDKNVNIYWGNASFINGSNLSFVSISEDISTRIIISINLSNPYNTGSLSNFSSNLSTGINITLPSQINFTVGTNFSLANGANLSLSNSSLQSGAWFLLSNKTGGNDSLNFNNLSILPANGGFGPLMMLPNGTSLGGSTGNYTNYSRIPFNVTGYVPGTYTINVTVYNDTSSTGTPIAISTTLTINVSDATAPNFVNFYTNSTGFSSITPVFSTAAVPATTTKVNLSSKTQAVTLYASVNVTDFNETGAGGIGYAGNGTLGMSFYFYNDTGILNYTNVTGSNVRENFGYNVTNHRGGGGAANLTDGNYMIVARNFRDVGNNTNATAIAYNVTIDGTNPTVTVAKSGTSTNKQIVLDITLSDATSGIAGKQCTTTGGGVGGIVLSGVTGTQTATQTDLGCNTAYTYTVACTDHAGNTNSQSVTVNTDACTGGSSSGTSGGSGSDVVGSANSEFWILTYNEATTDLNGDSDGVSSNLAERYRVKIKVDTKLYYVGVVDTTSTTAKINVTTTAQDKEATFNIGEIKKFDVNADDKYDVSVTLNGIDSVTGKADLSLVYIQEPVSAEEQAPVEEQVGEGVAPTEGAKSKAWIWVVIILAVLVILGAIFLGKKKSRFKNYGF